MSHQFSTETLRVQPPRGARFLRRSIPPARTTYAPATVEIRAEHQPGTCAPHTWPIRLTRCGEHPGYFGDNQPTLRLQEAR